MEQVFSVCNHCLIASGQWRQNWWQPWLRSSLLKTLPSLNSVTKSSVIGAWIFRVRSIDLFRRRRSRLTLMSLGFLGFGCTAIGNTRWSLCGQGLSPWCRSQWTLQFCSGRWYGICLGFWAIGMASSFIHRWICISWPSLVALPTPWKRFLHQSRIFSSSGFSFLIFFTALLGLFNPPFSSIFSMPSLSKLGLPSKGRESIFPFTTMMVAVIALVGFSRFMVHSPMMGRLWLSAFNFTDDSWSAISGLSVCSFRNWYSSMMFVSVLVSGSTAVSMPFMKMVQVFWMPWHTWL